MDWSNPIGLGFGPSHVNRPAQPISLIDRVGVGPTQPIDVSDLVHQIFFLELSERSPCCSNLRENKLPQECLHKRGLKNNPPWGLEHELVWNLPSSCIFLRRISTPATSILNQLLGFWFWVNLLVAWRAISDGEGLTSHSSSYPHRHM